MGKDNRNFNSTIYVQGTRQDSGCCDNWNSNHDVAAETGNNGCGCDNGYAAYSNDSCDNGCAAASGYAANNNAYGKQWKKNKCDECDEGTHVFFETCDGAQKICVTGTCEDQQSLGRVLDVTTTLENVCPGRRSAVGLTLTEVDENGTEYARGFRAITVPAHNGNGNRDIQLDSVRFILPDDLSLQRRRHFICRVNHHYMDADNIWG